MGWVKLDDGFFLHPKALGAGRDARVLYLAALCWSNQQQTDGVIPSHALPLIAGLAGVADSDQAASRLCEVALWEPHVDGWRIHDFLAYQQSKEEREEWKERERERKQRARDARKATQVPEIVREVSARIPPGVPRSVRGMSALEKRSEQKRSESESSSSGPNHQNGNPDAGEETTTTTFSGITQVLELVADALTAEKPRDDPASYRARIIANGDDHRQRLAQMVQPDDTPATLAERYIAARKRGPAKPAPRCGICGAPPHTDGVCPTLERT